MKNTTPLGNRIKKARKQAGLSQKELAKELKVSDKAISSYEVGRALPPLDTLREIGNVTHVSVTYLLDEDSNEDDFDMQMKLKTIEMELLAVKKILKKKAAA